jgi:hypothetical protein
LHKKVTKSVQSFPNLNFGSQFCAHRILKMAANLAAPAQLSTNQRRVWEKLLTNESA